MGIAQKLEKMKNATKEIIEDKKNKLNEIVVNAGKIGQSQSLALSQGVLNKMGATERQKYVAERLTEHCYTHQEDISNMKKLSKLAKQFKKEYNEKKRKEEEAFKRE